jgi:hypothetical protein
VDSALIGVLANLGTGGVVIVLIILGYLVPRPAHMRVVEDSTRKDEAIDKLQEALSLERQRSNDATQAGAVTNQLIDGLVRLATEHREHEDGHAAAAAPPAAGGPGP